MTKSYSSTRKREEPHRFWGPRDGVVFQTLLPALQKRFLPSEKTNGRKRAHGTSTQEKEVPTASSHQYRSFCLGERRAEEKGAGIVKVGTVISGHQPNLLKETKKFSNQKVETLGLHEAKEKTMAIALLEDIDSIVEQWRRNGDLDNPAGPLYISGRYAEADIAIACHDTGFSGYCGTACTYSTTRQCC